MNLFRSIASTLAPDRFPELPSPDEETPMKAVIIKEHGSPDVMQYVENFPAPKVKPGAKQLTVDIVSAGVNPVDFKMRKGPIADFIYPKPKVLGVDFAGIVAKVPENSSFQVGQAVYGMLPLLSTPYGSYASRCCVAESAVALAPITSDIPLEDLAAFPLVACTVIQAFRPVIAAYGGHCEGRKCCIVAGSGGVGTFAVQYASNVLGMEVTTFASPSNFSLLYSLGAKQVYDYHTTSMEEVIHQFDVFFDTMGYKNERKVYAENSMILHQFPTDTSHYIRIASSPYDENETQQGQGKKSMSEDPFGLAIAEARLDRILWGYGQQFYTNSIQSGLPGRKYHFVLVSPERVALEEARKWILAGKLRPVIDTRYPLEEAKEAHRQLEAGHVIGKLILLIPKEDKE